MSEIIFFVLITISILVVYCLNKIYDKRGLYYSLVLMSLITFIFSFKIVKIFTLNINLNIITMVSIYTIIYILIFKYNTKETKNILLLTTYTNVISALFLLLINYYIPSVTETVSISIEGTFLYNYKILIAYPIIMLLSEFITIKLFNFIKILSDNIYINIILTNVIVGLLYTLVFYLIAYINILKVNTSLFLGVTTFLVSIIITSINLILVKNLMKSKEVKEWEILSF